MPERHDVAPPAHSDQQGNDNEPNEFLAEVAHRFPRGPVLCLCDGGGRNGVWLAERGHAVISVDASEAALSRARRLAARRGVNLTTVNADVAGYRIPKDYFAAVVATLCAAPADSRTAVQPDVVKGLRPGGAFVFEGPAGPHREADTSPPGPVQPDEVRRAFAGLRLEIDRVIERDVRREGVVRTLSVYQALAFRDEPG